jgi:prolyl-tRNA synthetase
MSTRMVGAVVMAHGDDSGLQLPPRIAPVQVAIVPIFRSDAERSQIQTALQQVLVDLEDLRVKVDWRDERPGFKFNEWELKGVPLRIEIGPRDLAKGEATVVRRLNRAKQTIPLGELAVAIPALLEQIQEALLKRARDFREAHTVQLDSLDAMAHFFDTSIGFVITPWCGREEDERTVSQRTTATTRVILAGSGGVGRPCAVCGRPASLEVVWGKAY